LESDEAAVTDLSTAQAIDLIGQLAELGRDQPVMPVLVFSGGEPLCRDDLFELVGKARSLGITPALATNGTLINSGVAEQIRDSGIVRVAVSLDGATAGVHNKLRQMETSFERAIEGIGHLRDKNVPFQINITLTKHNAHQLEEVYELAKSLGAVAVHVFMLVPVGCGQVLAQTDMLSPQQYERMLVEICRLDARGELQMKVTCGPHYERVIREQGLYEHRVSQVSRLSRHFDRAKRVEKSIQEAGFHFPDSRPIYEAQCQARHEAPGTPHQLVDGPAGGDISRKAAGDQDGSVPGRPAHAQGPSKGCLAGLGILFVGHQGNVFPCGYLPVNCGSILKTRLADIWHKSKDLARMRDSESLEGKCGLCGYRQVCGGCRARAYAATGNYMAAEPFCAYIPPEAVTES
jgi:radical SAM protein with 4Fe4S-binding SPASM domain